VIFGILEVHCHRFFLVFNCFSGQKIYYSTHQFFLSPDAIYLVIFDIQSDSTYDIEYWLKSIRLKTRNAPLILVATHTDLVKVFHFFNHLFFSYDQNQEEIESKLVKLKRQFKKYLICRMFALSNVKKNNQEVKVLRNYIADLAVKRKLVGKPMPQSIHRLMTHLGKLREPADGDSYIPYMDYDKFVELALGFDIPKKEVREQLNTLHKLGLVLYYGGDGVLDNLVILDPGFLPDVMSSIISLKMVHIFKGGHVTKKQLNQAFGERVYLPDMRDTLLQLLQKFEVIYCLPKQKEDTADGDDVVVLVPAMFPEEPGGESIKIMEEIKELDAEQRTYRYKRIYEFEFLPFGFFTRFIVRILNLDGIKPIGLWRNGFIMERGDTKVVVEHDEVEYQMIIYIQSNRPR